MRSHDGSHGDGRRYRVGRAARAVQILMVGIISTTTANAQATTQLDLVYSDNLLPSSPIGMAEVVVGVMREEVAGNGEEGLVMDVPRSWAPGSAICVRATSADGRYSGEGAAVLPSEPSPRLELRLKSDYPQEFAKGVRAGQFIVRIDRTTCENAATRGGDGVSDDEEAEAELPSVAIAQWIGSSVERALIVHVDSGAASLVTARLEGAEGRLTDVIGCDARDSGQTYDHECRIDLENVPHQEATLVVERIRTGGRDDPARLRLDLRQPE